MLFLPQKPYLTDGTLREQIDFPLAVDPHLATDERTQQILDVSAAFFYLVFFYRVSATGFRVLVGVFSFHFPTRLNPAEECYLERTEGSP